MLKIFKVGLNVLKIADKALIGGAVQNILEDTAKNPKGKINAKDVVYNYAISLFIPILLIILFSLKIIDIKTVKVLYHLFN